MHPLQNPIAAALDRQVRALAQLRQSRVSLHQIIAVTSRMRRSEANTLQSVDFVNGFEEPDERRFAILDRNMAVTRSSIWQKPLDRLGEAIPLRWGEGRARGSSATVARHDLAEQGDFLHTARHQFAAFLDDIRNRPASFLPARMGHDAKRAVLVAPLHDADKSSDL